MKLLDLRKSGSQRAELDVPLDFIKRVVQQNTNRELRFEDPLLAGRYNEHFKLVLFPDPLGIVVVADKFIPKNTLLCPYGGQTINCAEATNSDEISYLLSPQNFNTAQQAKDYGDFGSLFCHLPSDDFLDKFCIAKQDCIGIQTANVDLEMQKKGNGSRLYFRTTQDIKPNTPIGYDYGVMYWVHVKESPILFAVNSFELIDLTQLKFISLVGFYDHETKRAGLLNSQTRRRDLLAAYPLSFVGKFMSEQLSATNPWAMHRTLSSDFALNLPECAQVLFEAMSGVKAENLMVFLPAHQMLNCAYPSGSYYDEKKGFVVMPKQ